MPGILNVQMHAPDQTDLRPQLLNCAADLGCGGDSSAFSSLFVGRMPILTDLEICPTSTVYATTYGLRYTGRVIMAVASASPVKLPDEESYVSLRPTR